VADREAIDRGMKAQLRAFRDAIGQGQPRLGWKIGINDPKMLERLELVGPVVGWLAGARALRSGDTYTLRPGTRVALEAEVAIRMGGGGVVAAIAPAFELVNYSVPADSFEGVLAHDISMTRSCSAARRRPCPSPTTPGRTSRATARSVRSAIRRSASCSPRE
jgi:hypothetical protein